MEQIQLVIQTGSKFGMQTMNQSLFELYHKRAITYQDAVDHSMDTEDLKRLMQKAAVSVPMR